MHTLFPLNSEQYIMLHLYLYKSFTDSIASICYNLVMKIKLIKLACVQSYVQSIDLRFKLKGDTKTYRETHHVLRTVEISLLVPNEM